MQNKKLVAMGMAAMLCFCGIGNENMITAFAEDYDSSYASFSTKAASDIVNVPDTLLKKKINIQLKKPEDSDITRGDMESLSYLSLDTGEGKIQSIEGIQYAVNLTSLRIDGKCPDIGKIGTLSNLRTLDIRYTDGFNFTLLDAMPNLETMDVFSVSDLKNLDGITPEKFPKLKTLSCARCHSLENIDALRQKMPMLESLDIEGGNKVVDLTPLKGYTSLKNLYLEKIEITDTNRQEYKETIQSLTGLTYLFMPHCYITDQDTDMFAPLQNLESLILNVNDITKTDFADQLPATLKDLGLYGNDISDMSNLTRFKDLISLGMGSNNVTDFRFIKELPKLTDKTIRNAEGSDSFPCDEYYTIGKFDDFMEAEETLEIENPYIDADGNPIPFTVSDLKITGIDPADVSYDAASNKIKFSNLKGDNRITLKRPYILPLQSGKNKVCNLVIQAYLREKKVYTVKYNWGYTVPSGVVLPTDSTKYSSLADAENSMDKTFTKGTKVKGTENGVEGNYVFSGWFKHVNNTEVKFNGHWDFKASPAIINNCPVIQAENVSITQGDTFEQLKGVSASDKEDGDLTSSIKVVHNSVDSSKAGKYEVTYEVTDSEGASCTKTIEVVVKEIPAPQPDPDKPAPDPDPDPDKPAPDPDPKPDKPAPQPDPKPETPAPQPDPKPETPAPQPEESEVPKTSDEYEMGLWTFAIILAGGTATVVYRKKKYMK